MAKKPASLSRILANTEAESKSGKHPQSIDPVDETSNAVRVSPITPYSARESDSALLSFCNVFRVLCIWFNKRKNPCRKLPVCYAVACNSLSSPIGCHSSSANRAVECVSSSRPAELLRVSTHILHRDVKKLRIFNTNGLADTIK